MPLHLVGYVGWLLLKNLGYWCPD